MTQTVSKTKHNSIIKYIEQRDLSLAIASLLDRVNIASDLIHTLVDKIMV
jgi:hypothetical protein